MPLKHHLNDSDFGDLNELRHLFEKPYDINAERRNMDKWNNHVGRIEYGKWKKAKDTGKTTDSIKK